jgi:hypothetical protein
MCIYLHREWMGVALEGQYPAITVLRRIAQWIEGRLADASSPPVIRVFDSMESLCYEIQHPECSVYRVDLKGSVIPHWMEEVMALIQVVDSALEHGLGALAYTILAGIVQENADFFFIPQIRDALEVAAQASGEISLSNEEIRTALEDYEEMVAALYPHRPVPELDQYTVWHDCPRDVRTNQPVEGIANNIVQESPSLFEAGKVWLRILTAGLMLRRATQTKGLPASQWIIERHLKASWKRFTNSERHTLSKHFHAVSGLSLSKTFGLNVE